MTSVREKMKMGSYKPITAYPVNSIRCCDLSYSLAGTNCPNYCPNCGKSFIENKTQYTSQLAKNRSEENACLKQFKQDAIEEVGLKGHPKADRAYALAWEDGHAYGIYEILNSLDKYASLLL